MMVLLIPWPFLLLSIGIHMPIGIGIVMIVVISLLIMLADIFTVRLVIPGPWKGKYSGYEIKNEFANNPKILKIAIAIIVVALFTSLGFLARALWLNSVWKAEVNALAGYEGGERASPDYRDGKLRLFVISGERDDDKFSGTNDGLFEIWFPQYYPKLYPLRYSEEEMVEAYNNRMKSMNEHLEKFQATTNTQEKTK